MHKATFLEGRIQLNIQPAGPILIKAGETGGADPTLPDMEFVRSLGRVYIPGSSLKGVIRAQCERICRSLDGPSRYDIARQRRLSNDFIPPLADNPLLDRSCYQEYQRDGDDMRFSCGIYFEELRNEERDLAQNTAVIYRRSSLVSQIFGHTSLASRVRFADAYPVGEITIEERNGVAIDRIYGSVAHGPFNYETVVAGSFQTQITFKNLTLAQLALLGLALRDLAEGRIGIGFGKSRGLGRVNIRFDGLRIYYPTCEVTNNTLHLLNGTTVAPANRLVGLGALCLDQRFQAYGLPPAEVDQVDLPAGLAYQPDQFLGVLLQANGHDQVIAVWQACMPAWRWEIGL
ncbi:RAMP superfamily CRISPR-associated protein [Chloroflexus sp.]|uniref:RAMP superfamily CRISPR-associated protein n=1 Tax=Chloroflexus sp. TaxID=1904827 RepID=UPI00261DD018|nr:RAMP superfamily CRISPR-associated protein [uncultured Chloroflexus sp.]